MAVDIPDRLRNEDFATCLVKQYLATDAEGRACCCPVSGFRGRSRPACVNAAAELVRVIAEQPMKLYITRASSGVSAR